MKCKDCGCDLDPQKHEWFYCPKCWEKKMAWGDSSAKPTSEQPVSGSADGMMKLIEALGGSEESKAADLDKGYPLFQSDAFWFQSPLIRASLQGARPKGIGQWLTFFWNIDFFIETWPVGKTLIALVVLLSFLF